jgi:hypothetical protein
MTRLYNKPEIENLKSNNVIFCEIYFHGKIRDIIGDDKAYIEVCISGINDKITKIEIPAFRQDGIYDVYTIVNGIEHKLQLYYWKIKTKQRTLIHKGLACLPDDKEAIKKAKLKLKMKSTVL